MRILRIRGKNLASLEGEFDVPLDGGSLATSGVFAICGPTGAGKSTLLDAMCLALFDTAPRLTGRGRVRVGREAEEQTERLTVSDPRTLLRKGTAEGYAEVEFLGTDRRLYRARWEVRRAKGRVRGKLQPTSMFLTDVAAEKTTAGRKTDVRLSIEARLGLSFDQFRRSVLLAQGDFAAFLDADVRDRADLLERMTGTEIYGAISQQAHERASQARRALSLLDERLQAVRVLEEDERAELLAEVTALDLRSRTDERAALDADRAVRWHHELEALARDERSALEERERIDRQLALAETKRKELEAYGAALPLRAPLGNADRARAQVEKWSAERTELERKIEHARAVEAQSVSAFETASQAASEAEQDRERGRAILERARALDQTLEALSLRCSASDEKLAEAEAERARSVEARDGFEAQIAKAREERAEAVGWLEEHRAYESLAVDWNVHSGRLARIVELEAEIRAVQEKLESSRVTLSECQLDAARAEGRARGASFLARDVEATFADARARAQRAPSERLLSVRTKWIERRAGLEGLVGVADRAQEAHEAERRHRDHAASAEQEASSLDARAAESAVARDTIAQSLREALHHRDRVKAVIDLSEHRRELVEGEACPLCGSETHPFADEAPLVRGLLDEASERVAALQRSRDEAEAARLRSASEADARRRAAAEALAEAERWSANLKEARAQYREKARALGSVGEVWPEELPESVEVPDEARNWGPLFAVLEARPAEGGALLSAEEREALHAAREEAITSLRELDDQERERRRTEREADRLRDRLERAREAEARLSQQQLARASELSVHQHRAASEEVELRRLEEERRQTDGLLAPALSGLAETSPLPTERAALVEALSRTVERWFEEQAVVRRTLEVEREILPSLSRAAEQLRGCERALGQLLEERRALQSSVEDQRAVRATLFAGAPAAEVEAQLRTTLETKKAAVERTRAVLSTHAGERRDMEAAHRRVMAALREAEAESHERTVQLRVELERRELDEAEVRACLARDRAEVEGWRRDLGELDRARATQHAVVTERQRKRALHQETDPPKLSRAEAEALRDEARVRLTQSRERLHQARSRVAQDDENRRQRGETERKLAEQRARLGVFQTLDELIGSATGNKLRVYAQSLTLELLLSHANRHLRELAPRYSLARVPDQSLSLQVVDHEMGDEVRAVGSLSGGESFLVALALALGLASLSSRRARVDSLFIDEGFGALDPASLELVLCTLDALQATGRQVGVISHVSTIAERFDTRVEVTPRGPASSRVRLVTGLPGAEVPILEEQVATEPTREPDAAATRAAPPLRDQPR